MVADQAPMCAKCGYDLTGLGDRRQCPECGEPFGAPIGRIWPWAQTPVQPEMPPDVQGDLVLRYLGLALLGLLSLSSLICAGLGARWGNPKVGATFGLIGVLLFLWAVGVFLTGRRK